MKHKFLLLLTICFLFQGFLYGQNATNSSKAGAVAGTNSSTATDSEPHSTNDTEATFTQRLSWKKISNVFEYKIILMDLETGNEQIYETTENYVDFSLSPGKYRYKIIALDFLGREANSTAYKTFTIKKVEQTKTNADGKQEPAFTSDLVSSEHDELDFSNSANSDNLKSVAGSGENTEIADTGLITIGSTDTNIADTDIADTASTQTASSDALQTTATLETLDNAKPKTNINILGGIGPLYTFDSHHIFDLACIDLATIIDDFSKASDLLNFNSTPFLYDAGVSVLFGKKSTFKIGFEVNGFYNSTNINEETYKMDWQFYGGRLDFVTHFSTKKDHFGFNIKLGGGLMAIGYGIKFPAQENGTPNPGNQDFKSYKWVMAGATASFNITPFKFFTSEFGINVDYVFIPKSNLITINPFAKIGIKF